MATSSTLTTPTAPAAPAAPVDPLAAPVLDEAARKAKLIELGGSAAPADFTPDDWNAAKQAAADAANALRLAADYVEQLVLGRMRKDDFEYYVDEAMTKADTALAMLLPLIPDDTTVNPNPPPESQPVTTTAKTTTK